MVVIFAFGDSITQGFNDPQGGWVERVRRKIQSARPHDYICVFNLGISGNRAPDILKRFDNEAAARIDAGEETIILVSVGGNDSAVLTDSGSNWTSMNDFRRALKEIYYKAKAITPHVFALGLSPCNDELTNPVSWDSRYNYRLTERIHFDKAVKELASESEVEYIDIMKEFLAQKDWKNLFPDGLHPAGDGHELIANAVFSKIKI